MSEYRNVGHSSTRRAQDSDRRDANRTIRTETNSPDGLSSTTIWVCGSVMRLTAVSKGVHMVDRAGVCSVEYTRSIKYPGVNTGQSKVIEQHGESFSGAFKRDQADRERTAANGSASSGSQRVKQNAGRSRKRATRAVAGNTGEHGVGARQGDTEVVLLRYGIAVKSRLAGV